MITITKFENAPSVPFNIDGKVAYSSDKMEIIHLTLRQGEEIPTHDNPTNVIFYVLEGNASLISSGQEYVAQKGDCIAVPTGMLRSWRNKSGEEFKVLVMKVFG